MKRRIETADFLNYLLLIAVFISILGFFTDVLNTQNYAGIDLRNRIVGARVMKAGYDPYFFKWQEGMALELYDNFDYFNLEVNRVTVTPTILFTFGFLAGMEYVDIRYLYLLIQWLLLLGSIYLLVSGVKDHNKRIIIWIMGLIFISSTYFWRLHVERGQVYILNVFLIALSYRLARSNKTALMTLAGLIFGFAVSLRPPLLLFSIPVLFFRKWKLLLGGIIGLPLGIFLPGIQSGHLYWSSYFSAMKIHALAHLGELRMIYSQNQLYNIEGITNWEAAKLPIEDSSLLNLFKYYLRIPLYPYILEIIFLILLVMMLVFIINKKKFTAGMDFVFLWGVLFVFLADFFIPAARYSYNNVIWLPVFALIIISERRLTENRFLLILLSLGLLFSVAFTYYALTPLISDYFILIFSVYYCMKLSEVHAEK